MPIVVKMPSLSPTMTEGKLVQWLKKEGDYIQAGEVIVTVETDKAVMELDVVDEGTLASIQYGDNTVVTVGKPICYLLQEGETVDDIQQQEAGPPVADAETLPPSAEVEAPAPPAEDLQEASNSERVLITPLARKLAKQGGLDIHNIVGTGPRGRITKRDVESFVQGDAGSARLTGVHPMSQMRKVIGARLLESKTTVPHFYLSVDVDMSSVVKARAALKAKRVPVTVHHFVVRATALALQDCYLVNVRKNGDNIEYLTSSDVAFALSLDGGLITPIVKNAEQKGLLQIAREVKDLSDRGRQSALQPSEFQGGSICISNLGMYGVKCFSAIINPPQSAILAVGAIRPELALQNGVVIETSVMTVTMSADHRLVDGVVAAEFLQCLKTYIEEPLLLYEG